MRRYLVDAWFGQLPDHDHSDAGTRTHDVPAADDDLGNVHHGDPASVCFAGADRCRLYATARFEVGHRLLHSGRLECQQFTSRGRWWTAALMAAFVLVL